MNARTDLRGAFALGFEDRTDELCRATIGAGPCEPGRFWSSPQEPREALLEQAFNQQRGSVGRWLTRLGVLPRFPRDDAPWAMRFLAEQAGGPRGPFATLIVVEVVRLVPELAGPGLLVGLVSEPFPSSTVRFAALDALGTAARPEDVPMLRTLLDSLDTRDARRALRALAATDRGAAVLLQWLRDHADRVPAGLTRELALSLGRAGALRDARLMGQLLASSDPAVVDAGLRAIVGAADHEDWLAPPVDLVASIRQVANGPQGRARRLAAEALGGLGEPGQTALGELARDRGRPVADRIQAALVLMDLDPAGAAALSTELVRAATSAREAYRAARLAAPDRVALDATIAELGRWARAHPTEAGALVNMMAEGNDDALIDRATDVQRQMEGGER